MRVCMGLERVNFSTSNESNLIQPMTFLRLLALAWRQWRGIVQTENLKNIKQKAEKIVIFLK